MSRFALPLLAALFLVLPAGAAEIALESRGVGHVGDTLPVRVTLDGMAPDSTVEVTLTVDGREILSEELGPGEHDLELDATGLSGGLHEVLASAAGGLEATAEVRLVPGWLSILPPVIAIALALVFKEVLVALTIGVFTGGMILTGGDPFGAIARTVDHFVIDALADRSHVQIVVFSLLLGGMVAVVTKSGGSRGIVERLAPWATSSRRGQLATWFMGVLIFFDDYANTLIVGSTMRPVTDRLKISREKLAYIVDSTAAPVASVIPLSTWIGFEVGLIAAAFTTIGLDPTTAFPVFVASIPYRFYPIFALVLGFTIAASRRDFGPMLAAERRAATGEVIAAGSKPVADYQSAALEPSEDATPKARNALVPVATVIVTTLFGIYLTGSAATDASESTSTAAWLRDVFANSDSYVALLWASFAGLLVALLVPMAQGDLRLREGAEATVEGFKSMQMAMVVLVLAWSVGAVCGELHTAEWLVSVTENALSPQWLPVIVFVLSAAVAFATGTSWGVMGILMPLVVPVAHGLVLGTGEVAGSDVHTTILLGTISSVLAGSVWGDHCSPISDTTILSSMASGSDHIAHVRTQLPYALGAGLLGMAVGDVPSAFGLSPWISILVGVTAIVGVVLWKGRTVEVR